MEVLELEPENLELENLNLSNINLNNDSINLSDDDDIIDTKPSMNFGSGIELLMNDKKSSEKKDTSIDIDDLDALEKDLNDFSTDIKIDIPSIDLKEDIKIDNFEITILCSLC